MRSNCKSHEARYSSRSAEPQSFHSLKKAEASPAEMRSSQAWAPRLGRRGVPARRGRKAQGSRIGDLSRDCLEDRSWPQRKPDWGRGPGACPCRGLPWSRRKRRPRRGLRGRGRRCVAPRPRHGEVRGHHVELFPKPACLSHPHGLAEYGREILGRVPLIRHELRGRQIAAAHRRERVWDANLLHDAPHALAQLPAGPGGRRGWMAGQKKTLHTLSERIQSSRFEQHV